MVNYDDDFWSQFEFKSQGTAFPAQPPNVTLIQQCSSWRLDDYLLDEFWMCHSFNPKWLLHWDIQTDVLVADSQKVFPRKARSRVDNQLKTTIINTSWSSILPSYQHHLCPDMLLRQRQNPSRTATASWCDEMHPADPHLHLAWKRGRIPCLASVAKVFNDHELVFVDIIQS